jgi:hypothetical protein
MLNQPQLNRINYLNIAAMLASACLAFIIPFELVLLSYAILGPAHYLTEISWLNARQFFTLKKYDYLLIAGLVILALLLKLPAANLIYYTFGLSFILIVVRGSLSRILAFIVLIVAGYFLLTSNLLRTIFGLYVPTLIHVYLFTGAFILFGALKDKIVSGYLAFIFFLFCPVLLCVLFTSYHNIPAVWAVNNFDSFKKLITVALRRPSLNVYTSPAAIILTRLIAFAYTYHYLNWFTKTSVIKWHRVSVTRALVLGVIWIASVTLYFYNYRLGIKWLFMLSLVHVILEFPLNHKSFIGIGKEIKIRLNGAE